MSLKPHLRRVPMHTPAAGVRAICALLLFAVLILAGLTARGAVAAETGEFTTKARHAILMDADTGAIVYQRAADELFPPASLSKLMTLAVVFRYLKSGQLKPSDEFSVSVNAWKKGGAPSRTAAMMIPVNTKLRLEELLQGIIVQSGNDASIVLAEGIAGSEAGFAKLMEAEARRIGMPKSTFANPTGLSDPAQRMTAKELAILARNLIREYPDNYKMFSQREFLYRKHKFINRNPLLFLNIGADGLKTGYLSESGYGIVGSAVQDGRRLIVVAAGLQTAEERKSEGHKLLDWGFKSLTQVRLFEKDEVIGRARVWGGQQFHVPLVANGALSIVLPKYPANQKLKAEIIYQSPLKPPVKKGDQVATLRVTSSSGAQNEVPLYAAEDVEAAGMMRKGFDSLVHLAFRWITL